MRNEVGKAAVESKGSKVANIDLRSSFMLALCSVYISNILLQVKQSRLFDSAFISIKVFLN